MVLQCGYDKLLGFRLYHITHHISNVHVGSPAHYNCLTRLASNKFFVSLIGIYSKCTSQYHSDDASDCCLLLLALYFRFNQYLCRNKISYLKSPSLITISLNCDCILLFFTLDKNAVVIFLTPLSTPCECTQFDSV